MCAEVTLRPVAPGDEPFLLEVYASTRQEELAMTGWSPEQRRAFVESQFAAQQMHFRSYYADAAHDIILVDGQPAGRSYVQRAGDAIVVLDITLLTPFRGAGTGTQLFQRLMAEADAAGKKMTLYVESFSRSLRLVERLGFRRQGENGVYFYLERPASGPA